MGKKRIVILGAGLAGLSAGWHLKKRGFGPVLIEKEDEPGGLCRSAKTGGFTFDYDGHLLHFKHGYTFELVKELLKGNLAEHKKSSWIYSHGTFTSYPFQANLYGLPSQIIKECLMGFIAASKDKSAETPANFHDWINRKFGQGIARHFMVPYNRKFWTIHPKKMNCLWLDGFIPVPSLGRLIEGTIHENRKPLGYNARFWYPKKGGIGQVSLAMARRAGELHTGSKVTGIDIKGKRVLTASGASFEYDNLISTLPLPEILGLIEGRVPEETKLAFKKLRWNSIYNLNLGIDAPIGKGMHWIYFPDAALKFFRVGFYSNFSKSLAPAGKGSAYVEVSYSRNEPFDKQRAVSGIEAQLRALGLLDGSGVCCRQANDIEYGYPIYDKYYSPSRSRILEFLSKHGIEACGRYGAWRYLSMEDAILDGRRAASLL